MIGGTGQRGGERILIGELAGRNSTHRLTSERHLLDEGDGPGVLALVAVVDLELDGPFDLAAHRALQTGWRRRGAGRLREDDWAEAGVVEHGRDGLHVGRLGGVAGQWSGVHGRLLGNTVGGNWQCECQISSHERSRMYTDELAGRCWVGEPAHVEAATLGPLLCSCRIEGDRADRCRRGSHVRLRPASAPRILADERRDRHQLERHEPAVGLVHERAVARVTGGDHRDSGRHRLGHREPPAFSAMQREVAVGLGDERPVRLGFEVVLDQGDVALADDRGEQLLAVGAVAAVVDGLQDQSRRSPIGQHLVGRRERCPVRKVRPDRVLAFCHARVVEAEEDAEVGAVACGRAVDGSEHRQGKRDHTDWLVRRRGDGRPHMLGGHPDLVDQVEGIGESSREGFHLPEPHPDRAPATEELRAAGLGEVGERVGIQRDEVQSMERLLDGRRVEHGALTVQCGPIGDRERRHPGCLDTT